MVQHSERAVHFIAIFFIKGAHQNLVSCALVFLFFLVDLLKINHTVVQMMSLGFVNFVT